MKCYPQLASRLFGVPLLIERQKLETILATLGPRFGLPSTVEAAGPGDGGKSRKSYNVTAAGIAVIDIVGPLVKRSSGEFLSGGPTTYGQIESEFTDAVNDPAIKGVLLQIDSPGGESTGCFELSSLIHSHRGSKPITAAIDGDAYSAAYAIACAADQVYLLPSGGTGSIGVWLMHADWSAANKKIGVNPTYLYEGARKIDGNPDNPLTEGARTAFQGIVARSYEMFVECVARNRGLSPKFVRDTEAALFFGVDAVAAGLVDKVGTLTDALKATQNKVAQQGPSGGATFSNARAIVETCALGGLTALASLEFLRPDISLDRLPGVLLGASAMTAEFKPRLTLPAQTNAASEARKPSQSGVVKKAEAMAAAAIKQRGRLNQ